MTFVKVLVTPVPTAPIAPMAATAISAAIRPYSLAVAALLSRIRFLRNFMRSEEHTLDIQSLMPLSYAVFCLTKTQPPRLNTLPSCPHHRLTSATSHIVYLTLPT